MSNLEHLPGFGQLKYNIGASGSNQNPNNGPKMN